MECNRFGWRTTALVVLGLGLLAGCNDRTRTSDDGAVTTTDFPWVAGVPTVPDDLDRDLDDDLDPDGPTGLNPVPDGPDNPVTNDPGDPESGPQISGQPEVAQANETFFFSPRVAADSAGLEFSVQNLPGWAEFDRGSGLISGTPATADVGVHGGIVISVSDGSNTSELGPLEIEVLARGDRSVTIAWEPPTTYENGAALTDLSGYTIRFGRAEGSYDNVIDVANAGLTSFAVDGLVPGTYFFATTAYNSAGSESEFSRVVSGKIP